MTKDIAQPVHLRYFLIYWIVEMDPSYKLYWLVYDIKPISNLPPRDWSDIHRRYRTPCCSWPCLSYLLQIFNLLSKKHIIYNIYFKIIIIILRNFFMTSIILLSPFFFSPSFSRLIPPNNTRDVGSAVRPGRPSGSQSPTGLSAVGMLRMCRWNNSSILGSQRSTKFSFGKKFSENNTHGIHVFCIIYLFLGWFLMVNVGEYTSPMDALRVWGCLGYSMLQGYVGVLFEATL